MVEVSPGRSDPAISVVICTCNRARLLDGALASLEEQELDTELWETIVVDNGSTDDTSVVVARYPRVRYVVEETVGLSYARNRGFAEAIGEYIGYADDDCILPPNWLKVAVSVIETHGPDAFGGPFFPFYKSGRPSWYRDEYGSFSLGDIPRKLGGDEFLSGGNMFFRRDLLSAAGGFDVALGMSGSRVEYGEETELQIRLREQMPTFEVIYEPRLHVEHLVREDKFSILWRFRAMFGKGRSAHSASISGVERVAPTRTMIRMLAIVLGGIGEFVLFLMRITSSRHCSYKNYLYEETALRFRSLGVLWGQLMSREGEE